MQSRAGHFTFKSTKTLFYIDNRNAKIITFDMMIEIDEKPYAVNNCNCFYHPVSCHCLLKVRQVENWKKCTLDLQNKKSKLLCSLEYPPGCPHVGGHVGVEIAVAEVRGKAKEKSIKEFKLKINIKKLKRRKIQFQLYSSNLLVK